ncbi:MAG: hypothetical protein ACK4GL_04770, partial [Flavobacteriales bacterium]
FNWSGNNLDDAQLNRFGATPPALGSGDRAQNNINWQDAIAFADWAGLRPMSEFEYEKICRGHDVTYGPIYPIRNEFAWGNTSINNIPANGLVAAADNSISEGLTTPATNQANCHSSNVNLNSSAVSGNQQGPVRCGIFAAKNFTTEQRRQAGASFYGVMEMTGNVREFVILSGHQRSSCYGNQAYGSRFQHDIHGDGNIPNGICDITTWFNNGNPSSSFQTTVVGHRGGAFSGAWAVSVRNGYLTSNCTSLPFSEGAVENVANTRANVNGFRAVRSVFN